MESIIFWGNKFLFPQIWYDIKKKAKICILKGKACEGGLFKYAYLEKIRKNVEIFVKESRQDV